MIENQPLPFKVEPNDRGAHEGGFDPNAGDPLDVGVTPLPFKPDVDAMGEERAQLQAKNLELIQGIARAEQASGGRMVVQPPMLFTQLKMRLDMLTDLVLSDPDTRTLFELSYERMLNGYLQDLSVQVTRAQLTAP